jgi:hypothetical protein
MKLSNRFTLLAFGVIGLSALAASPSSAQNASACRSSVGILGDFAERCLVTPEGNVSTAILSSVNAVGAAHDDAELALASAAHDANSTRPGGDDDPNLLTRGRGSIETTGGAYSPAAAASVARLIAAGYAVGGNGAAGMTLSRMAPMRTAVVAPTYQTTKTKTATGQTIVTNDHRTPAGAAPKPNSPPPAAAIGSMNNSASAQSGQTSMARDHRH